MKFWIIETEQGETIGCELTKKAAFEYAAAYGYDRNELDINSVDCDVSVETVRRLLGNLGGFEKA